MTHAQARLKHQKQLLRAHKAGELNQFAEAEKIYRRYIREYPQDPQVLFNLGVLVQRRAQNPAERYEAADFYKRCIESPEAETWVKSNAMSNFGLIMGKLNEVDKAAICFGMALKMNPQNNAARINFADMLRHNGEYKEADREFMEVLKLDPESAPAKFSAGMIALLLGDLKRGFQLYESRFETESFPTKRFRSEKPLWQGEDLTDRTLLVWEEQGFGDTFMFCRYFREIKKRWPECEIWFRGNILYRNIAKGFDGLDRFFAIEDQLSNDFDYHCALMSLPHLLGTTLETIPNETPYILQVIKEWKRFDITENDLSSIPRHFDSRHIGLCWAGSPRHGKDLWRSLAPEAFQSIIDDHLDCTFYSLQVGPRADECDRLKGIIDLAPRITDFTDTAQAILQLDLVISVDTAVVHLCGALDKECWMLTPHSPDWRWRLGTEKSGWYPRLKLFRQTDRNDWRPTLDRINKAL